MIHFTHRIRCLVGIILFLLSPQLSSVRAQALSSRSLLYRTGLSYMVQQSAGWGKGKAVITSSVPYSPAHKAGLHTGDIIEEIDGIPTAKLQLEELHSLLERPQTVHLLTITSLGRGTRKVVLRPESKPQGSVTERELARAFAYYSLRDEMERTISYPFIYEISSAYDLTQAQTFAFAPSTESNRALDEALYAQVTEQLKDFGLKYDASSPDLIIECFYELRPNSTQERDTSIPRYTSVFNPSLRDFVTLPLLPSEANTTGQYTIQLTVQFSRPNMTGRPIWVCTSRSALSEAMTLKDYAHYMLPLMLQGFPYVSSPKHPTFQIHVSRYNYTGIVYDGSELNLIRDIEDYSPAFRAGLRCGDRILSINGRKLSPTNPSELSKLYLSFISDTNRYRDSKQSASSDVQGGAGVSYWDKSNYANIRKAFDQDKYATFFSYLFSFRPYINETEHRELILEIQRGTSTYTLTLHPEFRDETTIAPIS